MTDSSSAETASRYPVSDSVRRVMQGNRGRDTKPEMAVRRELHRRGLRYRVASKVLPDARRTVDIAFPKKKIAVLIDGCFWHGCAEHYRPSHKNAAFWEAKVRETMRRDKDTAERLAGAGWTVVRFWEHESAESVADQVEALVRSASA